MSKPGPRPSNLWRGGSKPCPECGGAKWTGAGYRPHLPGCSRWHGSSPRSQQALEAATLRDERAPFPIRESEHWTECPCPGCEDWRRRQLWRAGVRIPGLAPERVEL